jgi:hypothetical protein
VLEALVDEILSHADEVILLVPKQAKVGDHAAFIVAERTELAVVIIDFIDVVGELALHEFSSITTGDDHRAEVRQVADDITVFGDPGISEAFIENEQAFVILCCTIV